MTVLIVGMLTALLIAGVVVALVAIPAWREGRKVLTPQGEQIVQAAKERTVDAVDAAKERIGDLAERLPLPLRSDSQVPDVPVSPALEDSSIDLRDSTAGAGQHRA